LSWILWNWITKFLLMAAKLNINTITITRFYIRTKKLRGSCCFIVKNWMKVSQKKSIMIYHISSYLHKYMHIYIHKRRQAELMRIM
jgi:hypothetical protein